MRVPTTIELLIVIGTTMTPMSSPMPNGECATNSPGVSAAPNQISVSTPTQVESRRRRGPAAAAPSTPPI